MPRKDRTGDRKSRRQVVYKRIPKMGYYLIVTDTEKTERCFFDGFRNSLPNEAQDKLVIKVFETKTVEMIHKCDKLIEECEERVAYDAQYRIPWIIFDRDEVEHFDEFIEKAGNKNIHVGWSNPCFEIWLFAYFGQMPTVGNSTQCCKQFSLCYKKETGLKYSKSDEKMYQHLIKKGDENRAIMIAKKKYHECLKNNYSKPSQMSPCTTVYELVSEIKGKIDNIGFTEK